MSENDHAVINGFQTYFIRYTQEELREAWTGNGQGNDQARNPKHNRYCCTVNCQDEEEALELSALFVRNVFAAPSCVHWNGETVSFYCGDAGSCDVVGCLASCEHMVRCFSLDRLAYISVVEKESGPLFARQVNREER